MDSGPLVAWFSKKDLHHQWATRVLPVATNPSGIEAFSPRLGEMHLLCYVPARGSHIIAYSRLTILVLRQN